MRSSLSWLQLSNFVLGIFLCWSPLVTLQSRTLVSMWSTGCEEHWARRQLAQCSSKLVAQGNYISIKGFLYPGSMGSRILSVFSSLIHSASLVCSSLVSRLLQIWSPPSPCPLGLTLHSVLYKLSFVHDMTTVSIYCLLHSWKSMLTTTESTRLAHPLVSCFFKIGGEHRL